MNVLDEIRNAVLDLQQSDYQNLSRPLDRLAILLDDPSLQSVNAELTEDVDLDRFLEESAATQGSMAGSAELKWPPERERQLGLVILLIKSFRGDASGLVNFGFTFYHAGPSLNASARGVARDVVVPFERDYRNFVRSSGRRKLELPLTQSNRVFVVHGHDEGAREAVARFVERAGLNAVILHEQANRGRTIIEKVESCDDIAFAVVLITGDDEGRGRGEEALRSRARQNVLLELGYFIGKLGRARVCALRKGDVEMPSDFAGVVWTEMDPAGGWKAKLAMELREAKFDIDFNRALG